MSKNLTRKGLALGAVVALGSSLFAGTPATAAPTAATLASAYGTSTAGVLGEYFYLSTLLTGGATNDELKYFVEGATAANLDARTRSVTDLSTDSATSTYVDRTSSIVAVDNVAKQATVNSPYTAGNYSQLAIKLGSGVTDTTSLKITAFVDSLVADNKPTAGEIVSSPVTVSFTKKSELTATPTIKSLTVGSTVKATVALSGSVNLEQLRTAAKGAVSDSQAINVGFTTNGSSASSGSNYAQWNTTDKEFVASFGSTAAAAGSVYGATAYFGSTASASATAATATAGEVSTLGALDIYGNSTKIVSSAQKVRAGSGKFTVDSEVTGVSAGKLKSGQKVTFKILEVTSLLSDGATITAGGKTLTASTATTAQSISIDAVSDASGVASIEVTYAGVKNGDDFSIEATAAPASNSTAITSGATAIEVIDSVATAAVDSVKSANSAAVRRIAKGGTFSVPYVLVDQFGQTPSGTFRAVASGSAGSSLGTPAITSPINVVNGAFTVTGTDNSTGAQALTISVEVQKQATDGTWPALGTNLVTATSAISVGTAVETAARLSVSQGATTGVARAGITFVAGNEDLEQGTVSHGTLSNSTTVTTTVYASTGAVAPGASVTLSAPGLLFRSDTKVWAIGSITVLANASGVTPDVVVASNLSGTQTITITSGSVSTTKTVKFDAATTGGKTWTVTAPTRILPGQTLKVSAVLKDKFGAPVNTGAGAVKVVYTGPGYVTTTIADETDADGVVSFSVLLGAMDAGGSTVSFTYGGADLIAAATTTDDVVATATILIGAAAEAGATAAVAGSTKRFFVSVSGNTGAKNVVVKVAGKTFKTLKGSTAKKTYTVAAPKGSHKVTVYVGGKLVATKTIAVK
jgi:hypothetical protein